MSQHSQSEPYVGTLKIFPVLVDKEKLNLIFYSDDESGLRHLKIADKAKGARLQVGQWFKLRGFKSSKGSFILDSHSSISLYNSVKPEITEEMRKNAKRILERSQYTAISTVKSTATTNYSRVSIKGMLICHGKKKTLQRRTDNKEFTLQRFRMADTTGTIRLICFDRDEVLVRNKAYIIHNGKKRFYDNHHEIEIDASTVIEATEITDVEFSKEMSDNEDEQVLEITGQITGIVCDSVNLYQGCLRCRKKVMDDICPNPDHRDAGSKKCITAAVEVEYKDEENKDQDKQVQVFTQHLEKILGKAADEFDDQETFEVAFTLICPVEIRFSMETATDGKAKMDQCDVVKRSEIDDDVFG